MFEQRHCLRFHNAVNSGRTCIRSTFKLNILYLLLFYGNSGYAKHCQREEREAGTNYRDSALRKGARVPAVLHMFVSFAVISLFGGRTN